jgi:hypothetical protein
VFTFRYGTSRDVQTETGELKYGDGEKESARAVSETNVISQETGR